MAEPTGLPGQDRIRAAMERGAPAPELTELGAGVDEDLALELVNRMMELIAGDRRTGDRYAMRLGVLASGMPSGLGAAVHVEVELLRGSMAFDAGRLSRAEEHARSVLDRFDEHDDPDAVGGAEFLLGGIARERKRYDQAIRHWDRSRRLAVAAQDWPAAARASASAATAAREGGRTHDELWRRWADAAELTDRAGDPDDARISGTNASVYAVLVLHRQPDPAEWDAARLREAAIDARAFALRFGADHEAAHLATLAAVATSDLAETADEVRRWTRIARHEYEALPERDTAEIQTWMAYVDWAEGNAAMLANDMTAAEPMLRRALTVFERLGDERRAHRCRMQLLSIAFVSDGGGDRARGRVERELLADADSEAIAAMMAEFDARQDGREAEAGRLHVRTMALLVEAGESIKALAHDLSYAAWRVGRGDLAAAEPALAAAESGLADPPPGTSRVLMRGVRVQVDLLRIALATVRGDRRDAIGRLARLEFDLLAVGPSPAAAQMAIQRGRLLLEIGEPAAALDIALPGALAVDAVRFTFADAGRRYRWGRIASAGFEVAFRAAAQSGQTRVIAELVEVARGAGVPLPVDGEATGIEALLAESTRELLTPTPGAASPASTAATLPGAAAVAHAGRTSLGLPARLRTPWGTVALAQPLDRARRYLDPIRAETVVEWTVHPAPATGRGSVGS